MFDKYRVSDCGRGIADEVRTSAYTKALGKPVKPGSVVVGTGTGSWRCSCAASARAASMLSSRAMLSAPSRADHGFDMQAAHSQVINGTHQAGIDPHELLSERLSWTVLDSLTVESPNGRHAEYSQ